MLILIRIIGVIIVGMGITFLLKPEMIKQVFTFCQQGKRIYFIGILRLLMGSVFLLTATQCRLVGVIITLGILILLKGVLVFILGLERVKSMLNWWGKRSLLVLRLMALIALAIGALLLYSV